MKRISILALSLDKGGAEKVIHTILPYLVLNHEIALVLFYNQVKFDIPKEVKVEFLLNKSQLNFFEKIFLFPLALYKYHKFLKEQHIEISISFLTRPNFVNSLMKIFNKGIKIVLSERCFPSTAYRSNSFRYAFYKVLIPKLYNKADVLFSNSIHINIDLRKNFRVKIPMAVIYNPVEIPFFNEGRKIGSSFFRIVNVASFTLIKNQKMIIDSIENLDFDLTLTLIGDGPKRKELMDYSHCKGLTDRIKFMGKIDTVNEQLLNNDCFVLSSNTEGFPNALLEAMAAGLPVISTNCISGPLELLNKNNEVAIKKGEFYVAEYGILINVNDILALSRAITYLKIHSSERESLGIKARERASQFTVDDFVEKLEKLLWDEV
ncbi:glycosyltransferase family 4 protein [Vitellibacter sp. q18]|nr:glycosyltransferase family 4 protein [Aequorivita lutea]